MYFYLFLAVSFLYYCRHCGTVHLHPDTILRKHGVHQRLKCLVVVKARTPRLNEEGTGKSGSYGMWNHPRGHVWNVFVRQASS